MEAILPPMHYQNLNRHGWIYAGESVAILVTYPSSIVGGQEEETT